MVLTIMDMCLGFNQIMEHKFFTGISVTWIFWLIVLTYIHEIQMLESRSQNFELGSSFHFMECRN